MPDKIYCPRCSKDITNSRRESDGYFPACWYCEECNIAIPDSGEDTGELNLRES